MLYCTHSRLKSQLESQQALNSTTKPTLTYEDFCLHP